MAWSSTEASAGYDRRQPSLATVGHPGGRRYVPHRFRWQSARR